MPPTAEDKDLFYREKDVTYSSEEVKTVYRSSKRHYPGERTFMFTATRTSNITNKIKKKYKLQSIIETTRHTTPKYTSVFGRYLVRSQAWLGNVLVILSLLREAPRK